MGTLHIGARHAGVEAEVAEVCGLRDSYQQRTIVTSIGYLMPDQRWVDWLATSKTAHEVAVEMAAALREGAPPWFDRIINNPHAVMAETGRGWLSGSAVELSVIWLYPDLRRNRLSATAGRGSRARTDWRTEWSRGSREGGGVARLRAAPQN